MGLRDPELSIVLTDGQKEAFKSGNGVLITEKGISRFEYVKCTTPEQTSKREQRHPWREYKERADDDLFKD